MGGGAAKGRSSERAARRGKSESFLLSLSDRLRRLEDPLAILEEAAAAVGSHLGVNRAGYAEVEADGDTFVIERDWNNGEVKPGAGRRSVASFGVDVVAMLYRGETQRIEDARRDPRVRPQDRTAFEEMQIEAAITVPLLKNGRLVAMFSLQCSSPRAWRDEDVALVEEVAERTWSALDRARTEARLRESEAQLRLLADNIAQLAWIADAQGSVYWYNKRWYEYSGAAPESMAGDAWAAFIHPADLPGTQQKVADALERGEAFELVLRFRRSDGSYRPFLTRVQPERSANGQVVRWFGTNTDITERLEAERASAFLLALGDHIRTIADPSEVLATANRMLGEQLGASRVGYAEIDATGEYIEVAHDWTDGAVQSVIGKHPFLAFGEQNVGELRAGRIFRLDDWADPRITPDLLPVYLNMQIAAAISVPLIKKSRLVAVLSVHQSHPRQWSEAEIALIREVAERTWAALEHARAEIELKRSQALLAAFLEHAPVGMYLKDQEGRYVMANSGMERIFGRPAAEAIGRTAEELLDSELLTKIASQDEVALREGRAQVAEQHTPGIEDGSWTLLIRFPVDLGAQGKRIGGFAIDVTEQKKAEAELVRSREALYQSEKLTALGSLLAGVSHELNNPLSVVVGQSTMLEEDAEGSPLAARAAKIRTAAERCARIVQAFLAMARQKPPERSRVDVNAVIEAALELTDYGARTAGIVVERDLAPGLPPLDADADQLHQVLANLFVNAQQALQEQPGERWIRVASRRGARGDTIEVEIADSGPGVSPEVRRRVFEPFFTTKPAGVGTGLGLSFSLGVVEAHGGKLELLDPVQGAAFRLTLPAASDSGEVSPASYSQDSQASATPGHALVVDDEPEIADMLAELLEGAGYRVRIADSGVTAQRQLAARDFDLILSDLRMPDLDGPGLHAWIRKHRPHLLSRIGFVTGDTLGPSAARFLASTDRPCLEKPFTAKALRHFVGQVAGSAPSEAA